MPNVSDRDLMRACAKFILGESTDVKVKGRTETIQALQEALIASRDLYTALRAKKPLKVIKGLAERKARAARRLRESTGIVWVL